MLLEVTGATQLAVPLALTETFSYAGVPPGTYTFSVRSVNAAGTSAASNPVTLTFGGCGDVPRPPAGFTATRTGNRVTVSWQPPSSGPAPTSYVLHVSGALNAALPTSSLAMAGAVPAGTYVLSVTAANSCGSGEATAVRTVTVP